MVRAIALVGFYKGDLVKPGQIIELTDTEWSELKAAGQVELAPSKEQDRLDSQIEAEFKAASVKASKK